LISSESVNNILQICYSFVYPTFGA
jgi:hypothetical protein